jgi:hypothetical protein
MAFFGSDWLEDYDSIDDYEMKIGMSRYKYKNDDYDKPSIPPVHLEYDYDSLAEYESGIKHFKE